MIDKKTSALIALVLASAGGSTFLLHHPKPTLRDVYAACESGVMTGLACCEDMNKANQLDWENTCGMIKPGNPDPFGTRKAEEDTWEAEGRELPIGVAEDLK